MLLTTLLTDAVVACAGNKIGDKGAKVIADALPSNSSLMHLDLSSGRPASLAAPALLMSSTNSGGIKTC